MGLALWDSVRARFVNGEADSFTGAIAIMDNDHWYEEQG